MNSPNEKERVYSELDDLRRRSFEQRREINALKKATDAKENAALRREASEYRKALSNIAYRLDTGGCGEEDLRSIVSAALLLRGLKAFQREAIHQAHKRSVD